MIIIVHVQKFTSFWLDNKVNARKSSIYQFEERLETEKSRVKHISKPILYNLENTYYLKSHIEKGSKDIKCWNEIAISYRRKGRYRGGDIPARIKATIEENKSRTLK
jgi:hypothetical protein